MNILLLEDNLNLASSLGDYLEEKGIYVDFAYNGKSSLELIKKNEYDVFVLDITMPGMNGLEVCERIRSEFFLETPVIFLTARDTLNDKKLGFNAGCDDYLVKPFEPDELLMRLNALNSRSFFKGFGTKQYGCLTIDFSKNQVTRDNTTISLHKTQFDILKILLKNSPNVVNKSLLENEIWDEALPDSDALRTHIYRLRMLIDKPFNKPLIQTSHGKGYSIVFD